MVDEYAFLQEAVYRAIDSLYYAANDIHASWVRDIAKREIRRKANRLAQKDKTNYELKLCQSGVAFTLYWYRVSFVDYNGKKRRKTKVISQIDGVYKPRSFRFATEWELQKIMDVEDKCRPIRAQLKNIIKMHRSLLYASAWSGSKVEPIKLGDRVELSVNSIPEIKKIMSF